ncbi:MAG: flagellar hook-associated protein FlgK [Deltaproteobacteria bacterium]|nr:flagellar hook-associated protein FlgK [Deltaproteobacteria bacterium]
MPGIGGALDIARWSMYASQLSIEVASHNIANANTEGYSRQTLGLEANNPITTGPGQIGTGVKATEVFRQYDAFVNDQVTQKTSDYAYWKAQSEAMDQIETIFNESDENGLNALMGEFWNAWADLSNNPDGVPERQALLATTDNLTALIRDVDTNLRASQRNINNTIAGSVGQVNSITSQIAELNKSISAVEIHGVINANDLRDKRDLLLGQLSELVNISYYEEEQSGQVMVYILGGTPLVLGNDTYSLSSRRDTVTGDTNIVWNDTSGRTLNITNKIEGGKLAGLVDARDGKIDAYLDSLNTLSKEIVWQVNSLHSEGVGLAPVSEMTGTVEMSGLTDDLGTDFLYSDRYHSGGTFDIVAYDASGRPVNTYTISPGGDTVGDLINEINTEAASGGSEITASLTGGTSGSFRIQANGNFTFAIKPSSTGESSNALAILGTNTFFSWSEEVGEPLSDMTETLDVNAALKANSELISSGYVDENNNVAPGSNEVALAIFGLQDRVIPDMGGGGVDTTMDAFYSSLVAKVGVDVQNAAQNEKFNGAMLSQYATKKETITGVNLDEEMTDLLKFQQLYQASAKLISICDEMMQALLSMK